MAESWDRTDFLEVLVPIFGTFLDELAYSVVGALFALIHALSEAVLPCGEGLEHVFIGPGDLWA